MVKSLLIQYGYPEDYLKIKYTCSECADTGFVGNQKCTCFKSLIARLSVGKMNAGSQIQLCSLIVLSLIIIRGKQQRRRQNIGIL